ncbi:MAG: thiolase family protein [Thermodesulfobacteriota bacterium]
MDEIVVVNGKRTPFGAFGGSLREIPSFELGGLVIRRTIQNLFIEDAEIGYVIMGSCLPGIGLSPGRQAVLAARLPVETNALTLDRACCSALTAAGIGMQLILRNQAATIVAGGMENMSRTPYLIPQMRWGARLGDITIRDELVIRNAYLDMPMAKYAGEVAVEKGVNRREQDEWALRSQCLWADAQAKGKFNEELIQVEIPSTGREKLLLTHDEHPRPGTTIEKLSALKPVYQSPTVTAGNSSGISDGATAIVLMKKEEAKKRNILPLGKLIAYSPICGEPRESPILPAIAIRKVLRQADLTLKDMKLIEINEAFAAMPLVSSLVLADYDREEAERIRKRLNVNGGAIAIGHPIGATGARLLMNILYELGRRGGGYGAVAICGAIGQADAMVVEV